MSVAVYVYPAHGPPRQLFTEAAALRTDGRDVWESPGACNFLFSDASMLVGVQREPHVFRRRTHTAV